MKKDDLKAAVANLRSQLNCDKVVTLVEVLTSRHPALSDIVAGANSMLEMIVASVGNFNHLPAPHRAIAEQIGIDLLYSESKYTTWIYYWTQARSKMQVTPPNTLESKAKDFYNEGTFVRFFEYHRRIILFDELLKSNLHTEHGDDELILEGGTEDNDPTIDEVLEVLAVTQNLAEAYCRIDEPNVNQTIRVTYLDLGSKWEFGIKVDGKAETGANLTKLLTEVFHFIMSPKAGRRSKEIEAELEGVDAVAHINQRLQEGHISKEEADHFKSRLLGGAGRLAELRVYPSEFAKMEVTKSAPEELDKLVNRPEFRTQFGLPSPNLALPPSPPEVDPNPGQIP